MRTLISIILLLTAFINMPLQASPLDDARAAGYVTEIANGYVKAQGNVSPRIKSLIVDVNKRRREAYSRIAKKNGISVEQVATESYLKRQGRKDK